MKMDDIKKIAKDMGLKIAKLKKNDLVRMIQEAEENIPCFATPAVTSCGQDSCLWRDDCIKANK
ncbi:MAG: SAP domain-containing protein [Gammaproteobacteria bacterium]|nr:SAP domain-containing protein [Gammaproteobacteria bacterium]